MTTQEIFDNNQAWINEKLNHDANYFENMSKGQSPNYLYIGCSDSRVTAEELMGASPGEVFVHRNIANMVSNLDLNSASVINYAVKHLKVKHVIICGHYYCGGVKAAMASVDLGILNPWLRNIRDVFRIHKDELDTISDEELKYKRLVELNVKEQCINVLKKAEVQQAIHKEDLQIHGWVFDIKTGKLIDLEIDYASELANIEEIYRID